MLAGGTGLLVVGGIVGLHGTVDLLTGQWNKANANTGLAGVLIITGGAAMLGSIPLFIAASKNRHKAINLTFTNQPIPLLVKNIIGNRYVPSISLKFNF